MQLDFRKSQAKGLFQSDAEKEYGKSHENPHVLKLSAEFLGEPNRGKHINYYIPVTKPGHCILARVLPPGIRWGIVITEKNKGICINHMRSVIPLF
ncbi:MAG: iron hydrogenase small subunit [Desulfosporosinus sp.]